MAMEGHLHSPAAWQKYSNPQAVADLLTIYFFGTGHPWKLILAQHRFADVAQNCIFNHSPCSSFVGGPNFETQQKIWCCYHYWIQILKLSCHKHKKSFVVEETTMYHMGSLDNPAHRWGPMVGKIPFSTDGIMIIQHPVLICLCSLANHQAPASISLQKWVKQTATMHFLRNHQSIGNS